MLAVDGYFRGHPCLYGKGRERIVANCRTAVLHVDADFRESVVFRLGVEADRAAVVRVWEGRSERKSWNAKKIRRKLLSESRELINDNMNVIATLALHCVRCWDCSAR